MTYTKVKMSKVGQDGYDLVLVSESSDEWTDVLASAQIVQKLQLILYPRWAAGHIDLLNGDVLRASPSAALLDITC